MDKTDNRDLAVVGTNHSGREVRIRPSHVSKVEIYGCKDKWNAEVYLMSTDYEYTDIFTFPQKSLAEEFASKLIPGEGDNRV